MLSMKRRRRGASGHDHLTFRVGADMFDRSFGELTRTGEVVHQDACPFMTYRGVEMLYETYP